MPRKARIFDEEIISNERSEKGLMNMFFLGVRRLGVIRLKHKMHYALLFVTTTLCMLC